LGKYYLGVKPSSPGYETWSVEPVLGDLQWMEGDVPTPEGKIHVSCTPREIRVKSDSGTGTLKFKSLSKPSCNTAIIKQIAEKQYELTIEKGQEYVVKYRSVE
jgi:hypothetical protein